MKFQGWDVALNHTAVVEVDELGDVQWFSFTTDKVAIGKAFPNEALHIHITNLRKQYPKKQKLKAARLAIFCNWIRDIQDRQPDLAAIEAYAYGKKNNAYEIGEYGGAVRKGFIERETSFLTITPREIKKFAGIAASEKPIQFCLDEYGVDWSEYGCGLKSETPGDLADAHCLAQMARLYTNSKSRIDFDPKEE